MKKKIRLVQLEFSKRKKDNLLFILNAKLPLSSNDRNKFFNFYFARCIEFNVSGELVLCNSHLKYNRN